MILLALIALQTWTPPECSDRATIGLARCARRDFLAVEELMGREFERAVARVRDCKPVNSTRCYNRPRALVVVRAEQRTWNAWRDAHCDVMAFSLEGTSAEGQVRDDCKTKLTVERIQAVKKIGRP